MESPLFILNEFLFVWTNGDENPFLTTGDDNKNGGDSIDDFDIIGEELILEVELYDISPSNNKLFKIIFQDLLYNMYLRKKNKKNKKKKKIIIIINALL